MANNEIKIFHDEVSEFMETGGGGGGLTSLPVASSTEKGGVIIGDGLTVDADGRVSLQAATASILGGVKIGTGFGVSNGIVSLQTASKSIKGGVKIGNGLEMSGETLNVTIDSGETYSVATTSKNGLMSAADKTKLNGLESLKPASESVLGGVIIGDGLGVNSSGEVSLKTASSSVKGGVMIGTGISIKSGTISLPTASGTQKGGVKIGSGLKMSGEVLYVDNNVILSSEESAIDGAMWYEI